MSFTKVTVTVELEIDDDFVDPLTPFSQDLVGEFVKVKSGSYENIACGHITSILNVQADKTEETVHSDR